MTNKKLLLIDGNSLAFRAFYAMYNQLDRMISHEGLHTNALVAFNNFLDQIVDPMQPDLAVVAWDAGSGKTTFRGELLTSYKDGSRSTDCAIINKMDSKQMILSGHIHVWVKQLDIQLQL
jgi:DNA polymerase I